MIQHIEDGLFDRLAGGTALIAALGGTAIYDTLIPDDRALPAVVFAFQGGGDTNRTPTREFDGLFLVKYVADDAAEAAAGAGLIRDRLHECDLALGTPWEAYRCQHTQAVKYMTLENRRAFWHAGGIYRIRATSTEA